MEISQRKKKIKAAVFVACAALVMETIGSEIHGKGFLRAIRYSTCFGGTCMRVMSFFSHNWLVAIIYNLAHSHERHMESARINNRISDTGNTSIGPR